MRNVLCAGLLLGGLAIPLAVWSDEGDRITIDNFKFGPAALTVAKWTEVTWLNRDDIPHSIVMSGGAARSKPLDTDQTFVYKFDKAGTFSYICGLHPAMHGTVTVK